MLFACQSLHAQNHCCTRWLLSGAPAVVGCCQSCSGPDVKVASRAVAECPTFLVSVIAATARARVAPDLGHMNTADLPPAQQLVSLHDSGLPSTNRAQGHHLT